MRFKYLEDLIGKRIAHIVVKERSKQPIGQLILVFEDGSCYEIYCQTGDFSGGDMGGTSGLPEALRYMSTDATKIIQVPGPEA